MSANCKGTLGSKLFCWKTLDSVERQPELEPGHQNPYGFRQSRPKAGNLVIDDLVVQKWIPKQERP